MENLDSNKLKGYYDGTGYSNIYLWFQTRNEHQYENIAIYNNYIQIISKLWGMPKEYKMCVRFKDYDTFDDLVDAIDCYCNNDLDDKIFEDQFLYTGKKSLREIMDLVKSFM